MAGRRTNEPVSEETAWQGLIIAEIRSQYYVRLFSRYREQDRRLNFAVLALSSAAFISILAAAPRFSMWASGIQAFLVSLISLYTIIYSRADAAARAARLYLEWADIARFYEAHWERRVPSDRGPDLDHIRQQESELSIRGAEFSFDEKLMEKCQNYVEEQRAAKVI
jgi:hypothetical protein